MATKPTTVTVALKPGVTYAGMHRVRVSHLPSSAVYEFKATLFYLALFGVALTLFVLGGPLWPTTITAVILGVQMVDLFVALGQMFAQAGRLERKK